MEQKLSNEEIARVFAMYWGCKVRNKPYAGFPPSERDFYTKDGKLIGLDSTAFLIQNFDCKGNKWDRATRQPYEDCKLLLTPLSSISDEDAIEVAKIMYPQDSDIQTASRGINLMQTLAEKCMYYVNSWVIIQVFQYLIQQGYAVPLFFGVGHWANGETALELNLAIDKTQAN